jgi:hypothetical protein
MTEPRPGLFERLRAFRASVTEQRANFGQRIHELRDATSIRAHPWRSIAIAVVAGVAVGSLAQRRRAAEIKPEAGRHDLLGDIAYAAVSTIASTVIAAMARRVTSSLMHHEPVRERAPAHGVSSVPPRPGDPQTPPANGHN